jgi:putative selenate reductase molybdopterin-binding subunit
LATGFYAKHESYRTQTGRIRHGIGLAVVMHGIGSDTILAQIAAEVLGVPLDEMIVYSSDTDFTPFDKGAYASSTTYISGEAVRKAAQQIEDQILKHAALTLGVDDIDSLTLGDGRVTAPDGRVVTLAEVALSSLHQQDQHQIAATASHLSYVSPPPTAAQFAEVAVDVKTGQVSVERLLMVVDCGRVINPLTAAGQVEGGMVQALGFALSEELRFDRDGQPLNSRFGTYHIPKANQLPVMDVIFVQTDEPSGPFGAKSVAEISIDGVAPALVDAIHDATSAWVRELPCTPERVRHALRQMEHVDREHNVSTRISLQGDDSV